MINKVLIRILDLMLSSIGLIILLPFFVLISVIIVCDSRGGAFYRQKRIGKGNKEFNLIKFRSMFIHSDTSRLITVGSRDPRVTGVGHFLRTYKLDELPQLLNVLAGTMSLVGPRPEVRKYVDQYNEEQKRILMFKPGITDIASIQYANENEILGLSDDPENMYIKVIMPEKIRLNLIYLEEYNVILYFKIIFRTVLKVIRGK